MPVYKHELIEIDRLLDEYYFIDKYKLTMKFIYPDKTFASLAIIGNEPLLFPQHTVN